MEEGRSVARKGTGSGGKVQPLSNAAGMQRRTVTAEYPPKTLGVSGARGQRDGVHDNRREAGRQAEAEGQDWW